MTHITNTTALPPKSHLLTAAIPNGIETMEANGQTELVNSELLPTDRDNINEQMTAEGFVFGAVVENDPIFQHVQLPEGWSKRATDHAMWSDIVDADGTVRYAVFYKAAFYDRAAFMRAQ